MPKTAKKEYKEYHIDAENKPLGRVASQAAIYLRGKSEAEFQPHILPSVKVKITNCGKVKLTGKNKVLNKSYKKYTGYPGSLKKEAFSSVFEKDPRRSMRKAIEKMMPRNRLRRDILKNLTLE